MNNNSATGQPSGPGKTLFKTHEDNKPKAQYVDLLKPTMGS